VGIRIALFAYRALAACVHHTHNLKAGQAPFGKERRLVASFSRKECVLLLHFLQKSVVLLLYFLKRVSFCGSIF
jgi:hypothetical protein